jgi:hypothetical protein
MYTKQLTKTLANMLVAANQIETLNLPAEPDYRSVYSFTADEPLCEAENEWIQHKEDLVTIRSGREHAWLDSSIERILRCLHCPFVEWIFCSSVSAAAATGMNTDND